MNELWQIFADNGQPIKGAWAEPADFGSNPDLNMGNAHIWFWRRYRGKIEIMLQKRALTKPTRPGWFHISAGGHINSGETPLQAAVREAREEMGLTVDPRKLFFVQATRTPGAPRDIKHVYLYLLSGKEVITHHDGEAESFLWTPIERFKEISQDAANHNLVPQGEAYFKNVISALEFVSGARRALQ